MLAYTPESPAISEYASFVWEIKGNFDSNEIVLPSGVVEIVFNLSQPISAILPGGKNIDCAPHCFIQGIHTNVTKVSYSGQHHLFGLRLRPHAVRSLLGVLPSELSNEAIDITLIKPQFQFLWDQLVEVQSFAERVKLLETNLKPVDVMVCRRSETLSAWFSHHSFQTMHSVPPFTKQYDFSENDRCDTVDGLAQSINYSTRHLNRKTQEIFGLTAVELIRYKRFLQAVLLMHSEKYTLTQISHRAGFFDQSHFIRVFRSFANMTPSQYLQIRSRLPYHLFE